MATKYLSESVQGGVVDTRDLLYLKPGEVSYGNNCFYRADDDMLCKVPVIASALASAASPYSPLGGMKHIVFNDTECLLVHGAGAYYRAPITSASGALGSLTALASAALVPAMSVTSVPTSFAAVQYNNKYILMDGLNTNYVMRSDNTLRQLGMQPVVTPPIVATATAAASTWPGRVEGYFDYWYTEVCEYSGAPEDLVVESAYEATASTESAGAPAQPGNNRLYYKW
jgi:hypothetical protein